MTTRLTRALRAFCSLFETSPAPRKSRRCKSSIYAEALEPRTLLTAVIAPVWGIEHTSQDDGEAMKKPPVYLIFWGDYWNTHGSEIHDILFDAAGIITSPAMHIVDQYGADGS